MNNNLDNNVNNNVDNNLKKSKKNRKLLLIIASIFVVIIIAVVLFIVISPFGSGKDETKENEKESIATPILYEVTKDGYDNKIYLFGSIHVADDRAYPMPDKVLNAYEESDYLAVEFDMIEYESDYEQQLETVEMFLLEEGKILKDILKEDTYNKLVPYLEENYIYDEMLEYYSPAFFENLISNIQTDKTGLSANKGIDEYFLKNAKKEGKEVLEVESSEYQLNLMLSFPYELYDFQISYGIDNEEDTIKELNEIYELWLEGNEEEIIKLITKELEYDGEQYEYENLEEMLDDYDNKLVYQRNIEMADKAEEYFNDKKDVFYVVGTAHIIGEDAIVDLLRERGYTVTRIKY